MNQPLKIEKLVYEGAGVGFVNRQPIFVPMTVPGDEIECRITKKHKGFADGVATRILRPSPNRTTPKCEYFGRCGGCQWQHMDYACQILWKQIIVEEQLRRIGKIRNPNVLPTIPSPKVWNYRNRVKMHRDKSGRTGFYAPSSHELVEIGDCLLVEEANKAGSCEFFTQVNPAQNENLKALVVELVEKTGAKNVLELYCGNGNLTFAIAEVTGTVEASDSDKKAVVCAKEDAAERGVKNICFKCEPAQRAVNAAIKNNVKYGCMVVDPPRDGCKDISGGIIKLKPPHIIYISCNPATMARDIHAFAQHGYKLESAQPIDMFPQTYHIETVASLYL